MIIPAFSIWEKERHKDAVNAQLISGFVFHYIDSTIPLPKSNISSPWPSFVVVQTGLCQTWLGTWSLGPRL